MAEPFHANEQMPAASGPAASRRTFLKTLAASSAAVALTPAASYARILGANERVTVGIIGMGRMARGHLNNLVKGIPEAQVVALADVYRPNLDYALRVVPEAEAYGDFRRVLDRADVDVVVVGTPDHWHALPTVLACEAGKDVYVEKPTSVTVEEGRRMVEAARRYNRVVQVGTQQRSGPEFQKAAEIVQSGVLGPISFVRTWNYGNEHPEGIGNPPDGDPPPDLDWEMWLGPAPKVPFNPNRFGIFLDENLDYQRYATFRWFWDYAGGMMTDWGVHLLDIVQMAMKVDYPLSISATGGKFYLQDNRETPDTIVATFEYPGFVCTYENRVLNAHPIDGKGYGITFHGTEGTLFVNRSGFELTPEKGSALELLQAKSEGSDHLRHMRDFLASVKSRRQPISDIEVGHRSSSTAILGNIAYRTGRRITWDGARERIVGDAEASRLLASEYRSPWAL